MASKKSSTPRAAAEPHDAASALPFEQALERLETIVDELEGGELTLQESLARYEEGIRLSRGLTHTLDQAEQRIERLVENPGQPPTTEPLELDVALDEPAGGEGELPF